MYAIKHILFEEKKKFQNDLFWLIMARSSNHLEFVKHRRYYAINNFMCLIKYLKKYDFYLLLWQYKWLSGTRILDLIFIPLCCSKSLEFDIYLRIKRKKEQSRKSNAVLNE